MSRAAVRTMAVLVAVAALAFAVRDGSSLGAARVAPPVDEGFTLPSARGGSGQELAAALAANDEALRAAIDAWRAEEDPPSAEPPPEVMGGARYLNRTVRKLAKKRTLARSTVRALPKGMRAQIRSLIAAQRDLFRLSAGWPAHDVETGDPEPLRNLSGYYDEANQRYGIHQHYLAAVHFVESKFGRVKNDSVAGAQGPMQFIPTTWDIYGEGDIQDDHDAILAAARLLKDNGAPGDYPRALRAYNNSSLYVDAVTRYAKQIERDRHAVYFFYCFGP